MVSIETINEQNEKELLKLHMGDIPPEYVEKVEYTISLYRWGQENDLEGMCLAVKDDDEYVGIILFGEAILADWEPEEVRGKKPFRIIGFMIDSDYRSKGIGTKAFSLVLDKFNKEYGNKPILLECHCENTGAQRLYEKFGFANTGIIVNNHYTMLRVV